MLAAAGLFVAVIGPWPVYKDSQFAASAYCKKALADIDKNIALSDFTATPGTLKAGWGVAKMTPKVGTPLGGLSARMGRPSTGVHDDLYSKAICLSDGKDTVALIGDDILIVPRILPSWPAERSRWKCRSPATTSCSVPATPIPAPGPSHRAWPEPSRPASWTPPYLNWSAQPWPTRSSRRTRAWPPAKLADAQVDAPEFIRNRTRNATTDSMLKYLVVEKLTGEKCFVIRYSAHPTNFGEDQMGFSAEFPGALQRYVEAETKGTAIYLGGAVGSMGPRRARGATADERVDLMGRGLARKMLDALTAAPRSSRPISTLASVGVLGGHAPGADAPHGPRLPCVAHVGETGGHHSGGLGTRHPYR